MKLYSQSLELAAVRTICDSRDEEVKAFLLSSVSEDWFHFAPTKAAYSRIHTVAKKRSVILSFMELVEDPAMNEEYREILKDSESRTARDMKRARALLSSLDKYRKTRALYRLAKDIILSPLQSDEVDVDGIVDSVTNSLTQLRSSEVTENMIHTLGHEGNALDDVDEALSVEDEILLKTGFAEIDDRNGGVVSEGVGLLAATTSGGKSALLMNLLMNMYKLNKISVANLSLEMQKNKLARRMLSKMTRIPFWKFVKKALTTEERHKAKSAWRKFYRYGEKYKCQFANICPTHSISIDQALMLVKPYGYKVIGIDYAGLLAGVDEKDQWKTLGSIVRQCKIFSTENHCLVILLAQLDSKDDHIRYSGAMLEHADFAWAWNYTKREVRDTHTLPMKQVKARDQELYDFELKELFEVMSVEDMEGAGDKGNTVTDTSRDVDLNDEIALNYDAGQQ